MTSRLILLFDGLPHRLQGVAPLRGRFGRLVHQGVAEGDAAHRLLAQLPVRERAALVLRYWLDCSDAQVAEHLDVRLGTAKSLLRRGTARLRDLAQRPDDDATAVIVRDMNPRDTT